MTSFTIHNAETAPADSKDLLRQTEQRIGMIPNLYGVLAEAPVAAEAYDRLSGLMMQSSFSPTERHVVWFTLNSYHGSAFSCAPRLTQSAWFRPHNRSEEVEGLYLVGAGTHPGAGVPGVILSAETTYRCIAEDHGLPRQWDDDTPGETALATDARSVASTALAG